tara:strand:+ start:2343 stop:2834 length:492 start_codon:yes stop_codon:yes gene_type:complete
MSKSDYLLGLINEMSYTKPRMEQLIHGLGKAITLHLFKLIFWGELERKWIKEIKVWLMDIQGMRWKNGNKLLKRGKYFDQFYNLPIEGSPDFFSIEYSKAEVDTDQPSVVKYKKEDEKLYDKAISDFYSEIDFLLSNNSLDVGNIQTNLDKVILTLHNKLRRS